MRDISTHWVLKALLHDSRSAHIGNQTSGRQASFNAHNERPETMDQKYERIPILPNNVFVIWVLTLPRQHK